MYHYLQLLSKILILPFKKRVSPGATLTLFGKPLRKNDEDSGYVYITFYENL